MKRDMISIETPEGIKLRVPAHTVASTFIAAALAQIGVPQSQPTPAANDTASAIPALGEYWPGQGGVNAGLMRGHDGTPDYYLIVATKDAGSHEWGGRGKESCATSKWDGLLNAQILLSEGGHPAAQACAEYQVDGHCDFYLPAAAELYQGWLNTPELFSQDCWYWSSSQRSANYAFLMTFGGGGQDFLGKDFELRVRPVRRFFI